MKLNIIIVSFFSLAACTGNKDSNNLKEKDYVEFNGVEKIYLNPKTNLDPETGYDITKKPITDLNQKTKLVSVLVYYSVPVRFTLQNNIEIPLEYFKDTNYLYNLTIKSRDTVWLEEHILPH